MAATDRALMTCTPPGVLSAAKWPRSPHAKEPETVIPDSESNRGHISME